MSAGTTRNTQVMIVLDLELFISINVSKAIRSISFPDEIDYPPADNNCRYEQSNQLLGW
jgi:hypothetical protein